MRGEPVGMTSLALGRIYVCTVIQLGSKKFRTLHKQAEHGPAIQNSDRYRIMRLKRSHTPMPYKIQIGIGICTLIRPLYYCSLGTANPMQELVIVQYFHEIITGTKSHLYYQAKSRFMVDKAVYCIYNIESR